MSNPAILRKLGAVGRDIWSHLPPAAHQSQTVQRLGRIIHVAVRKWAARNQTSASTYFLRNLPLIQTVTDHLRDFSLETTIRITFVGCGTGPEVYSFVWMFRKAFPTLPFSTVALDISPAAVEMAKTGCYRFGSPELRKELSTEVVEELFDPDGTSLRVKHSISHGIRWLVADARDPSLIRQIGPQDLVLANNFLIHMKSSEAKACMCSLLHLLRPGGLFVCRGVDLNVRELVTRTLGLEPITEHIAEIHDADPDIDAPKGWPWKYWGLEPINWTCRNWEFRYSAIFRVPHAV